MNPLNRSCGMASVLALRIPSGILMCTQLGRCPPGVPGETWGWLMRRMTKTTEKAPLGMDPKSPSIMALLSPHRSVLVTHLETYCLVMLRQKKICLWRKDVKKKTAVYFVINSFNQTTTHILRDGKVSSTLCCSPHKDVHIFSEVRPFLQSTLFLFQPEWECKLGCCVFVSAIFLCGVDKVFEVDSRVAVWKRERMISLVAARRGRKLHEALRFSMQVISFQQRCAVTAAPRLVWKV